MRIQYNSYIYSLLVYTMKLKKPKSAFCNLITIFSVHNVNTEKSIYKEPTYKELLVIRNWFYSPIFTKDLVYYMFGKKIRYKGTDFHGPEELLIP